jgi:hypothetical protein
MGTYQRPTVERLASLEELTLGPPHGPGQDIALDNPIADFFADLVTSS